MYINISRFLLSLRMEHIGIHIEQLPMCTHWCIHLPYRNTYSQKLALFHSFIWKHFPPFFLVFFSCVRITTIIHKHMTSNILFYLVFFLYRKLCCLCVCVCFGLFMYANPYLIKSHVIIINYRIKFNILERMGGGGGNTNCLNILERGARLGLLALSTSILGELLLDEKSLRAHSFCSAFLKVINTGIVLK